VCINYFKREELRLLIENFMFLKKESIMKLILILAILSLMYLPVSAQEPVYLGGATGASLMRSVASQNTGLIGWGSTPYSNYYFANVGLPIAGYPPGGYRKGLVNPYGEWIPYMLYTPTDFYTMFSQPNPNRPPSSFFVQPPLP
jgi:hypothetical protein